MSKEWGVRPSELLGLNDDDQDAYTRWCLDEACSLWGNFVDSEVSIAGNQVKNPKQATAARQMRLKTLLTDPDKDTGPEKFADPAERFGVGETIR